jgi:sugar/nucleoside kinase (ribokinase family)
MRVRLPDVAGNGAVAPRYDIVGIGNALVDVISHHDDLFLGAHDLVKGAMTLIDIERALALHRHMRAPIEMSGGSAANTMCGVASFGGRAAYIGKVAADGLGEVFRHDLHAVGVAFPNRAAPAEVPTGRCLIVVTPDAQRTMNTFLGMSSLLVPDDVSTEVVQGGAVLYMEGYLYDRPEAKQAFRKAARVAHAAKRKVSLTLSDSFCVDRHRDDFRALVTDEVDVLFANRDELCSLYETEDLDSAVRRVREDCELAAITCGSSGSRIITADEVITVDAEPVKEVVDTTGAGDLYAAGFLYGLTHGAELAECGRLGSLAAAEVISHVGARPLAPLRQLAGLH